jgi:hypothetical protein
MNIRLLSVITASILSIVLLPIISIAKPTIPKSTVNKPNINKPETFPIILNLGGGVKFTFQGCSQMSGQEKVICTGIMRSSNGEQLLTIYRDYNKDRLQQINITDSKGRSYIANEFRVGDEYICQYDSNTNCTSKEMTLVEGVDYKTTFTFTEIALPSPTIPLLSVGYYIIGGSSRSYYLKYRNIPVIVDSVDLPNSQNKR